MDDNLLQLYFEGRITDEQSRLITEWLDADVENLKYYQQMCRLYEISYWQKSPEISMESRPNRLKRKDIWMEFMKIAAVFILGFALHNWINPLSTKIQDDVVMQTMHVPPGQNAQLTLADGSQVWLNAGSTLRFPSHFVDGKRQIYLDGEGFFEVKTNPDRPFIVSTANYDIKALGTSFNVKAYKQTPHFETALLTGKIEVSDHVTNEIISLIPNKQAVRINNKLSVVPIQHADYFLWRKGILNFDEPLIEVLQKLELYFDVNIQVNSKAILQNKQVCTGKFRTRDGLNHILDVLKLTHQFDYKKDDEKNLVTIN
ncbi:FecR family protein [Massilibacteroides vaginae]|uniref:FecR family protein n=1 Tax=Massilibacteroides vaginae TaxID=1673718 RepID=UPI000A1CD774|nr:FecR domain-containing protein [Massilibacteroides vaginae]